MQSNTLIPSIYQSLFHQTWRFGQHAGSEVFCSVLEEVDQMRNVVECNFGELHGGEFTVGLFAACGGGGIHSSFEVSQGFQPALQFDHACRLDVDVDH